MKRQLTIRTEQLSAVKSWAVTQAEQSSAQDRQDPSTPYTWVLQVALVAATVQYISRTRKLSRLPGVGIALTIIAPHSVEAVGEAVHLGMGWAAITTAITIVMCMNMSGLHSTICSARKAAIRGWPHLQSTVKHHHHWITTAALASAALAVVLHSNPTHSLARYATAIALAWVWHSWQCSTETRQNQTEEWQAAVVTKANNFASCSVEIFLVDEQRWIEVLLDTGAARNSIPWHFIKKSVQKYGTAVIQGLTLRTASGAILSQNPEATCAIPVTLR